MKARNIVVKIGSAVLTQADLRLDRGVFCSIVGDVAQLMDEGHRVTVVSSGAVATGRRKLAMAMRPKGRHAIPVLQALAALGQARLIQLYDTEFAHYDIHAAQVLLTRDDFNGRVRYLNARNTLEAIVQFGAVPIVNENDTVAYDEIRFGDNDQLAALVATMIRADTLVILSDVDGLYDDNPRHNPNARVISQITASDPSLDAMVGDTHDTVAGVGAVGMITKLAAARIAATTGITTVIGWGKRQGLLQEVVSGETAAGTYLTPERDLDEVTARKAWIHLGTQPSGRIWCDPGAVKALVEAGKSLLPSGVTRVEGTFSEGDALDLVRPDGKVFGRGLATYGSDAMRLIAGKQSGEIGAILGYKVLDAVVHRDDLVISEQV